MRNDQTVAELHRQVALRGAGGPEMLVIETVPRPTPGPGQVLVRMQAAGVAFGDVTQRQGRNPGRLPAVLGYDVVGEVAAVGDGVENLHAGERVIALTMVGGYAEYVLAPARWTVPVPAELDAAALSALTLNYLTAWQMLHRAAHVEAGKSVLVLGAAGGVGSALVELAHLAGARAYGTASTRRQPDLTARGVLVVADADAVPEPVDATFDPVGGPSLTASRRATVRSGVVVAYGFTFTVDDDHSRIAGLTRAALALLRVKLTPGARVVSFQIGASGNRDPEALRADLGHLVELLAQGRLHPHVQTLPLAEAADAHRLLEGRRVDGKLILVATGTGQDDDD